MPPFFFEIARRLAPKSVPRAHGGVLPANNKLMRSVTATNSGLSFGTPVRRSFRCCGRRPSGPAADPFGNDWIAALTAGGMTSRGWASEEGVERRSVGQDGWRRPSSVKVDWSGAAKLSLEHSSWAMTSKWRHSYHGATTPAWPIGWAFNRNVSKSNGQWKANQIIYHCRRFWEQRQFHSSNQQTSGNSEQ